MWHGYTPKEREHKWNIKHRELIWQVVKQTGAKMTAEEDRFKREARQWFILAGRHIVNDPLFDTLEEGTQRELNNIVSNQEHPVRLERAAAEEKYWKRVAKLVRVGRERRARDLAPLVAKHQERDARVVRVIVIVWVAAAITTLVLWLFRFAG